MAIINQAYFIVVVFQGQFCLPVSSNSPILFLKSNPKHRPSYSQFAFFFGVHPCQTFNPIPTSHPKGQSGSNPFENEAAAVSAPRCPLNSGRSNRAVLQRGGWLFVFGTPTSLNWLWKCHFNETGFDLLLGLSARNRPSVPIPILIEEVSLFREAPLRRKLNYQTEWERYSYKLVNKNLTFRLVRVKCSWFKIITPFT